MTGGSARSAPTSALPEGMHYVNDHTIVQAPDGRWHLFGIFHAEPMRDYLELDFVHAVAEEHDPARWQEGAFVPAPEPYRIALHADPAIGEKHAWAPHVVRWNDRWMMVYQSGGADDDHAAIRLAESDDLYHWSRVGNVSLFEDFCVARDPMLVRREGAWAFYYTRCDSVSGRHSGVAYRLSHDLVHWSEPRRRLLALGERVPARVGRDAPLPLERPVLLPRRALHAPPRTRRGVGVRRARRAVDDARRPRPRRRVDVGGEGDLVLPPR